LLKKGILKIFRVFKDFKKFREEFSFDFLICF
jgi:hypothetical protein